MLDRAELQRLQDQFCGLMGVCVYCLDKEQVRLTKPSGNDELLRKLEQLKGTARIQEALERVEHGSLEDQVIEVFGRTKGENCCRCGACRG